LNLIILGPPGAGKGTQANALAKSFDLKHISTGDLFRFEVTEKTTLGIQAKAYMDRGELVPDTIVIQMIQDHLPTSTGFLLDGFPRTIDQAHALEQLLVKRQQNIDIVFNLEVNRDALTQRLLGRGRDDDHMETILNRLDVFDAQTKPLIQYYQDKKLLHAVDGNLSINDVFTVMKDLLKNKNHDPS